MKRICKECGEEFETKSGKREICFKRVCSILQQNKWKYVPKRIKLIKSKYINQL